MPKPIESIVEEASAHPLVSIAAHHIEARTEQMRQDHLNLANTLKRAYECDHLTDWSGEGLQRKVRQFVEQELDYVRLFDIERKKEGAPRYPYQVNFHKMGYILEKVKQFVSTNESNVVRLVQGQFSPDESFFDRWPMLRTPTYWGSNGGTIEGAKLLCARFATSNESILDYAMSSIAHWTPCEIPNLFDESRFLGCRRNEQAGFGFVHGGYAFGGQRTEKEPLLYGPEDCSSFVANALESATNKLASYHQPARHQFTTTDVLLASRAHQSDPISYTGSTASPVITYLYNQIERNVGSGEQSPGDLLLIRTSPKSLGNPDLHSKGAGHIGIVIARDPEIAQHVLMFEANRDMEKEDPTKGIWGFAGIGIGSYSIEGETTTEQSIKRTVFLRPKR